MKKGKVVAPSIMSPRRAAPQDSDVQIMKMATTRPPEGIACYQWNGENFKEIEEEIQKSLSGYAYMRDDDIIIDYNDGASIKRVKPFDWILILKNDEGEDDMCVLSDKMLSIILASRPSNTEVDRNDKDDDSSESDDQGVDVKVNTRYGDRISLSSFPSTTNNMYMTYSSCMGDDLKVEYENETGEVILKLDYRDGTSLEARSHNIRINGSIFSSVKTVNQLYDAVHKLVAKAKKNTDSAFTFIDSCVEESRKKTS